MIGLNQIFSLFELINSEKGTNSIAVGFALGMVFGFVPSNPVILAVLFFFFCLFRIHGGAMFLSWALFGLLAYALDPLFDVIGYRILTEIPALTPAFTKLYNMPVVPWSLFNNSIVMGSLVVSVALFIPAIFIFRFLIQKYQATVLARLKRTKFFTWYRATTLYKLYGKYQQVRGMVS